MGTKKIPQKAKDFGYCHLYGDIPIGFTRTHTHTHTIKGHCFDKQIL